MERTPMSARNTDADVLTWGCPVAKRLVRGRLADGTKLPKAKQSQDAEVVVSCPACGEDHRITVMTRPRRCGECLDADPVTLRKLSTKRGR
jgi:hypothetical protein